MRPSTVFFFLAAVLLVFPLSAQTLPRNEFGASVGVADMGDFGDAGTLALSYNRYWTEALSTRLALTGYGADLEVVDIGPGGAQTASELAMGSWSAALEYHVLRDRRISPYVAAGVAYVAAELVDTPAGDIEAENELAGIVGVGADLNLTRRWALNVDATYMPYAADFPPIASIAMDPLTLSAGVKVRW